MSPSKHLQTRIHASNFSIDESFKFALLVDLIIFVALLLKESKVEVRQSTVHIKWSYC